MRSLLPRVIALSPTGSTDPGVVVAGCRAGALGVLDLGFGFDAKATEAAHRIARYVADRPFGFKLPVEEVREGWLREMPDGLRVVIVGVDGVGDWSEAVAVVRATGRLAVAEIRTREQAVAASRSGFDALIVAGHEAGGQGGDESTLILLQAALDQVTLPVWARGGIGLRSASACVAARASGVVLDGALLLARESPLAASTRERVARWDGGETVVVGRESGAPVRVYATPGSPVLVRLKEAASRGGADWARTLDREIGWGDGQAWPAGQDSAFAASLARRFVTVGGIVRAVDEAIDAGLADAQVARPLAPDSSLARSHGTRYPIVQGPMTRVSDTSAFAAAVAEGGGLPFLALSMMRGEAVRPLLDETRSRLAGRPWGVGLLGFISPELRREQVEAICQGRPPFALIAGGRPDQAKELEDAGISTYLHVPSPGLLRRFWDDGARRFVLEGRECGGHVGPRSSLILWEQAVEAILERLDREDEPSRTHVLFAGGIHDHRSASAVAVLAAPLAKRGVNVGVLIGTAYLFTTEAVETGAIVSGFQAEALRCERTVLLETGPGHEVRVSPSPFTDSFDQERRRLVAEGKSAEEVQAALEALNVGRLRIAAKGVERAGDETRAMVPVAESEQAGRGLYMLGQAATLRNRLTTIAELHEQISVGSTDALGRAEVAASPASKEPEAQPSDVAIVGMSAIVPGASDVRSFWENTLRGVDSITEVPADRFDWRLYYDQDPKAPDKVTSKWGGFVPEIPFDPLRYGMPPASLPSIEPLHLLTLEAVRAALDDAGYRDRPFPRERTAVVLGAGGGAAQLAMGYAFRSYLPLLDTVIPGAGREALEQSGGLLPEWTEDSFPGILLNVAAGRVANRFDLGGANYTVDAACGSSLAAAALAVRELESGAADVVLLGGADTVQNPFTYLAFSKTHAFSPKGRCRPFDASADGIVISEGVAVLVLKRLADAERDGDRIYAVIKGLGAGSDGRAKGLTAPHPEGQVRALRRAYAKSGVSPESVGYVEAHGTGTAAGDLAEVQALRDVFSEAGAPRESCALGSVKSLIGHTKCAAGLAGLINASLALYHRVLPPTIGVQTPNPKAKLSESPFHVNTKTRPWLHAEDLEPRRAGVSAFGFGGTNFHAVLESYEGSPDRAPSATREWPAELLVWRDRRESILAGLDRLAEALDGGARPLLRDLAETLASTAGTAPASLAIVATSLEDLRGKLRSARAAISRGLDDFHDPSGIAFRDGKDATLGKVAFLFPGQGAQRLEMLGDLAVAFPEVREGFESFDRTLRALGAKPVGNLVFPPHAYNEDDRNRQERALSAPEVAQPALGAASVGLLGLLESLGVTPDLAAGHSYGELVALHVAGSYPREALAALSEARGRFLNEAAGVSQGAMAALASGPDKVATILEGIEGVAAVNWNGPRQTVISGGVAGVDEALERAKRLGVRGQRLQVACAFHSPLVASAKAPLESLARTLGPKTPRLPVYSNVTGAPYPGDASAIASQIGEHLARPVQFAAMVEAMHDDGARVFVEVGPGNTLTSLVGSILGSRPHLAVACNPNGRPGIVGLLQTLGRLFAAGLPLRLARLTEGRECRKLDPVRFRSESDEAKLSPSTWLVNGARSRPSSGPEPAQFGRGPALPVPPKVETRPTPPPAHRNGPIPSPSRNGSKPHEEIPAVARPESAPSEQPEVARVFEAFQKTMQTFLDVQRETMLGFLSGQALPQQKPSPPIQHPANGRFSAQDFLPERHAPRPADPTPTPPPPPRRAEELEITLTPPAPPTPSTNGHAEPAGASSKNGHAEPAPGFPSRETLADRLLAIVRDRTGYPAEMLRLDLDLEADLGIDSIKRVEILGSLRDTLPDSVFGANAEMMDQLARARTLGAIVDRVAKAKDALRAPKPEPVVASNGTKNGHAAGTPLTRPVAERIDPIVAESRVQRRVIEAVEVPLSRPARGSGLMPGGLVLLTDDGRGVARALAADLRAKGHAVVRVGHDRAPRVPEPERDWCDLTSPASVEELLNRAKTRGRLAGIIHAQPLGSPSAVGLDPSAWAGRLGPEVRGLFLLAKAGAGDLARAARQGGACLIAGTAMGGGFASVEAPPEDFFPGQGGIAGLIKTLAREWPKSVRVRVVDLDPTLEPTFLAANLAREIESDDPNSEVGYVDRRRIVLRAAESEVSGQAEGGFQLAPGAPIVVTGGARGITSSVALDLARRWRPTLLLVGSSPLPTEGEDAATVGIVDPAELKGALHRVLSRGGRPIGPADLERAYQGLRREREIRDNLRVLRSAGAEVHYARADVRDRDALGSILAGWRQRFGPVAGLIHGAGVIQDKLLRDKTPESFDRVLGTKLEGALNLAGLLDRDPLKFAAFFSSVAGRFGNRGQADYAAANEALNKLAIWLDRRWAARVVSIIWGPWSGVGMVSDLEGHLGRQGMTMIAPEDGSRRLAEELIHGRKGDVEVILAGALGNLTTVDDVAEPQDALVLQSTS